MSQVSRKSAYAEKCESDDSIPLFAQAWWLDATCGPDGWDVSLAMSGDEIAGALPYRLRRRTGFVVLTQPMLTQFLGPWIRQAGGAGPAKLTREKEVMAKLIDGLPPFAHYGQNWSPEITNWLPFYWRGFKQTTQYTMQIHDLADQKSLWDNLEGRARTEIRKSTSKYGLRLRENPSLSDLFHLNTLTFSRQDRQSPYDFDYLLSLDKACVARNSRKMFIAEDADGQAHAGAYVVWDKNRAYYLLGGGDPNLRNSGASSLCIWEAILFSASVANSFDFEGSMIEPVERFFRSFGATQVPYFHVSKTNSRVLQIRSAFQSIRRA